MKSLRNAFELYINSSIHVALAVTSFALISILEHKLSINKALLFFIFFGTITGYNFVKYSGIAHLHHLSLTKNLRIIQIFSLICFFALVYFTFQLSLRTIIAAGILGLLTMFYAVPVMGKSRNLRSLSGMKIFIIALVWAGTTVIIPSVEAEKLLGTHLLVDFLQRIMLVITLTLPFEIRDLKFDEQNLGTIPQRLGVRKTKVFGTILLGLIFFIELFQGSFQSVGFLALTFTIIVAGGILWMATTEQKKFYSSFWVEAVPLFYLFTLLLFRHYLLRIL